MQILRYLYICLVSMLACLTCHAQMAGGNYFFTHIDVRNGLTENTVKSITQDSWGFVWLGTKNGLNRYDGVNIKQYQVYDSGRKFGNNNVSALFPDEDGLMWIGTDKGVFTFDPASERFDFFDLKTDGGIGISNWISQITSDHKGNIWVVSATRAHLCTTSSARSLSASGRLLTRRTSA